MLIILLFIPFLAILNIFLSDQKNSLKLALFYSIINFLHISLIIHLFDNLTSFFQFQFFTTYLLLGLDGISIWLIWLINILQIILILYSYKNIKFNIKLFIISLFIINFSSIAVFLVLDLLFFFICFEFILIPMFYVIGFFGSRNKKFLALNQLILYTILGSLPLIISIISIYIYTGTTDYSILLTIPLSFHSQIFLWFGFFISLAIKIPMFPFHIWLPLAHTEGNTIASVILAAILLKLGTYGFLRFVIPLFPLANLYFLPLIYILAIISIFYSCIAAISLIDLKQIIAYSSIAHMNVSIIGIFSNNLHGLIGSYIYSISHGLISTGLFLLVGLLYDRFHTRNYLYYRGLILIMPLFSFFYFLFNLFNISFPGTSGFISEFLIYYGNILNNPLMTILITLVSILLPVALLLILHKIIYGQFSIYLPHLFSDFSLKEFNLFLPLIFWIIYIGMQPNKIIKTIELTLINL
jgi:proton-translocating NADH-quinone oxidoreductase chain M